MSTDNDAAATNLEARAPKIDTWSTSSHVGDLALNHAAPRLTLNASSVWSTSRLALCIQAVECKHIVSAAILEQYMYLYGAGSVYNRSTFMGRVGVY